MSELPVQAKAGKRDGVEAQKPQTKYDFGPGESLDKGYFAMWQVGVPPKQAKRGCVWTTVKGFVDMAKKGFLTGEALRVYRQAVEEYEKEKAVRKARVGLA